MDYAVTDVHVDTARGRFAVRAVGNPGGSMVVALHGFADHPATFDAMGQHLAAHGYVTVAPYLRAQARSPADGADSWQEHAADLRALVAELSPDRAPLLVGHGEGAWVVHQALAHGLMAHRVLTLGTPAPEVVQHLMRRDPRVAWSMRHVLLARMGSWGRGRLRRTGEAELAALWKRWSPAYQLPPGHLQRITSLHTSWADGSLGLLDYAGWRAGNHQMPQRILYLMGENDGALPPRLLPSQRSTSSHAQVRVLPGVGHFPHLEVPQATFDTATEWFAQK